MARRFGWSVMFLLTLVVASYALTSALVPGARDGFVADLFADKALRAFGHLAAGGVVIVAGALQFSTRIRWRWPSVHRGLGFAYLVGVLVSGISAVAMAPTSNGGITGHLGFGILGVLWIVSTSVAFLKIRTRDYEGHRAWMIRSYALCLAAVTLRIYLPFSIAAGIPFEDAYPAIAWLCWVPNLVFAEWLVIGSSVAPLEPPSNVAD